MSVNTNQITPDVQALLDYSGEHLTDLFATVVEKLNVERQRMQVILNLTADTPLIKMTVGDGIRPYNGGEQYESALVYSKRKIRIGSVKKEVLIDAKKYKRTYLSKYLRPGANVEVPPFAEWTMSEIAKKFAAEINGNLLFKGRHEDDFEDYDALSVYAAGDLVKIPDTSGAGNDQFYIVLSTTVAGETPTTHPAKFNNITKSAATDGFKILIDELIAGGFSQTTIGAIDNDNVHALTAFRTLARKLDDAVWDDDSMTIVQYCSLTDFQFLMDDIEDKLSKYTVYDLETGLAVPNQMYLPGSNNKVIVQAVSWLSGSRRIVTTVEGNLAFGTNLMSDINQIATKPNLWTLGVGMLFDFGVQIADDDAKVLAFNDQA
jgi:hypothetical protein